MPKKVVFIGPAYPYKGGIAAFNESLATTFQQNGWACKMYTFSQQIPFLSKEKLTTEDPRPNLTIKRGIYSANPLNWLKISKEIVKENPDLVITQYWMPYMAPAFGTILRGIKKERPNVKIATFVHNFKPHQGAIGDKQLNKYITKRTDLIFCLSDLVKKEIEETIKDKSVIKMFHPIYDHYGTKIELAEAKQQLGWDEKLKYLLFFGEIKDYKGLDRLIESLSLLKKDLDYKLYIAGEFLVPEKKITELIKKYSLEDKVKIRNEYIPNEDVPKLFCGASAIVTPYKITTQSGIIPIALHFERPVIASKVGDLAESITHHQLGVIAEADPASLAESLDSFLTDKIEIKSDYTHIKKELSWQSFFDIFVTEVNNFNAEI